MMERRHRCSAHRRVAAGGDERRRLAASDLDREARPRENADARRREDGARDLVAEGAVRLLEALAEPHHGGIEGRRKASEERLEAGHRRRDDDDAAFTVAQRRVEVGPDLQRRRQHDLGQIPCIAPRRAQPGRLRGVARPKPGPMRGRGVDREGGAPRACAEHRDVHRRSAGRRQRAARAPVS